MLRPNGQRPRFGALALVVATVIVAPGRVHAQAPVEFLHAFTGHSSPAEPTSLLQAADGNFYGTTERGGTFGRGTVFRITPDGTLGVIHEFSASEVAAPGSLIQAHDGNLYGTADGGIFVMTLAGALLRTFPVAATMIMQGRDGNLYGTTGAYSELGGIFRMTLGGIVTTLHLFTGGAGGRNPHFLIQAGDGHFYGLTRGGVGAWSTLFQMTMDGGVTTLKTFGHGNGGGYWPRHLLQAQDGTFYLTTTGPGAGTIMQASPGSPGSMTWRHGFSHGGAEGWGPTSLAQGADGAVYGTTGSGGAHGNGALFRMPVAEGPTVLHAFAERACCRGTLIQAGANLWGLTEGSLSDNSGTVYKVAHDGTYSLVHRFSAGPGGANPQGPLLSSADGHFYGTTSRGGSFDRGTVFRMTPSGDMTVLHEFSGGSDGAYPIGDLVQASDGSFYGATHGDSNPNVFKMSPGGIVTPHYQFSTQHGNVVSLVGGTDGVLFGTTDWSIFSLTLNGVFRTLAAFDYRTDGVVSRVVEASNGNLYGMTTGKFNGSATIFTLRRDGTGFNVIATLPSQADWEGPYQLGGLIQASDGNLYGTIPRGLGNSRPTALRVSLDGTVTALHHFTGQEWSPFRLVQGSDGNFYGGSFRSVVRMDLAGNTTILHDFGSSLSVRGLVQGSDGLLYGTTHSGGPRGYDGTVFRLNPFLTPFRPALVTASAAGMTGVSLRWSPVAGAMSYTIRRITPGGAAVVIASGITGLSFTDTTASLAAGASYVVVAVNLAGESLTSTAVSASRTPTITTARDYDGDRKADVTVYRGSTSEWLTFRSTDRRPSSVPWGSPALTDRPVAADYDGDGQADIAVYRETSGEWFVLRSSSSALERFGWGAPSLGDIPIPGDYDGDGAADLAVFRGTTGEWLIRESSSTSLLRLHWGAPSFGNLPVPADYDGDGQTDVAVYRTTTGEWFVRRSSDSALLSASWGAPALSDVPVPADYDGDGRMDIAIYRGMTGGWFVSFAAGGTSQFAWGSPALADVPVPADYDGDGLADPAVFRASTGEWFVRRSSDLELVQVRWGAPSLGDSVTAS